MLTVDLILLALLVFGIIVTRGPFARMWAEMGVSLPWLTRVFVSGPWWAYVVVSIVFAAALLTKECILHKSLTKLRINIVVLWLECACGLVYLVSLFTPIEIPMLAI